MLPGGAWSQVDQTKGKKGPSGLMLMSLADLVLDYP